MRNYFLFLLSFVFLFLSCKSKKNMPIRVHDVEPKTTVANAVLLNQINQRSNTFSYLSADVDASYNDGKNNYDFDIKLVLEKDKYIYFSASAFLGIEVARAYITPHNIQIVNRLERSVTVAGYDFLKDFTRAPLGFKQLQNLFIGNALFVSDTLTSAADSSDEKYFLTQLLGVALFQKSAYNKNTFKLVSASIIDSAMNQNMNVFYSNFYVRSDNFYPSNIAINIAAQKNVACTFKLSNFAFEKKREIQFSVPKNYKVINR